MLSIKPAELMICQPKVFCGLSLMKFAGPQRSLQGLPNSMRAMASGKDSLPALKAGAAVHLPSDRREAPTSAGNCRTSKRRPETLRKRVEDNLPEGGPRAAVDRPLHDILEFANISGPNRRLRGARTAPAEKSGGSRPSSNAMRAAK